jgi:hypothetical protein
MRTRVATKVAETTALVLTAAGYCVLASSLAVFPAERAAWGAHVELLVVMTRVTLATSVIGIGSSAVGALGVRKWPALVALVLSSLLATYTGRLVLGGIWY